MLNNTLVKERMAILSQVAPTASTVVSGQTVTSDYVDLTANNGNLFSRFAAIVQGYGTAAATITVSIVKASDTSATGKAVVVTQTATIGTASATMPVILELDGQGVYAPGTDTTKKYYAVEITSSGASTVAGVLAGFDCRYPTAAAYSLAATAYANA